MEKKNSKIYDVRAGVSPLRKFWANLRCALILDKSKRDLFRERTKLGIVPVASANVEFAISCGNACRPAHNLRLNGLRKFSSPLDWTAYEPDVWFLPLTDVRRVMRRWEEQEPRGKERSVTDTENGILILHDFSVERSVEEQMPEYRKKLERRSRRLREALARATTVGIAMSRPDGDDVLARFLEKLSSMFPQAQFRAVNVRNRDQDGISWKLVGRGEKWILAEASFRDDAYDPRYGGLAWKGNERLWSEALQAFFRADSELFIESFEK